MYLLVKDTCSLGPLEKKEKRVRFMVQRTKFSSFIISKGARRLTGLDSIDSRILIVKKGKSLSISFNLPGAAVQCTSIYNVVKVIID